VLGPSAAVIGVGINVRLNTAMRGRIGRPATDVASQVDAAPSRTALLAALLPSLAATLAQFSREGFAPFREEWLRLHVWRGRRVALSMADRRVAEGKIVGVAEDGALMLASARGVERFHGGELSLKAR
jgi:BirA family biotin operon repressor/biotin-[acetyl-CoA-carboxylase] ligase